VYPSAVSPFPFRQLPKPEGTDAPRNLSHGIYSILAEEMGFVNSFSALFGVEFGISFRESGRIATVGCITGVLWYNLQQIQGKAAPL